MCFDYFFSDFLVGIISLKLWKEMLEDLDKKDLSYWKLKLTLDFWLGK